jgi:dephospho-CoA kinase
VARPSRHILRIGVTGGIGSGKSTACRIFKRLGTPVISADEIAKQIADSHPTVRKEIIGVLDPKAYDVRRRLNRPYVASRLFGNKRIQRSINAILHPRVLKEIQRRIRVYEERGRRLVVVEAALIFEAGMEKLLDLVIVIETKQRTAIQRVKKRDDMNQAAVKRRIASQWSITRKRKRADIVLRNDGTAADLRKKIRFLLEMFRLFHKGRPHA